MSFSQKRAIIALGLHLFRGLCRWLKVDWTDFKYISASLYQVSGICGALLFRHVEVRTGEFPTVSPVGGGGGIHLVVFL